jgi:hypothetical protein
MVTQDTQVLPGTVMHTCNPRTWMRSRGQPGLHIETLSQKTTGPSARQPSTGICPKVGLAPGWYRGLNSGPGYVHGHIFL